ncbi:Uncharacterized protein SCF082_LOCUS3184 [Durusdinium trenchii]|uniref:Uncharacterized protein n=1 Tax=Durusdinium trenchii TaxID=1381693 RepID=A0ABP0HR46_9DINO
MAHARAAEQILPDDSVSSVGSNAGSGVSWTKLTVEPSGSIIEQPMARPMPTIDEKKMDATPDDPWAEQPETDQPTTAYPAASAAAPPTQAARNLLEGVNETPAARRLRRQQERADRKGANRVRWGQVPHPGHSALNFKLPTYLRQIGSADGERSVLVLDSRDQRLQSPYQGWLLDEILVNAQAGINIHSERTSVRSPNAGYHLNIFYVRTLDGRKLILVGSMSSYSSVPAAKWDGLTGSVLSHQAFQPFRWPLMRDDSATWVDLKVKVEGSLLLHLELRGYRSDRDMTVQLNYINDALVPGLADLLFVPSIVVTVFQGWRVVAISFEVGGRLYACSDGGIVVALDHPLCHFELRLVSISSADSFGWDADRMEMRFVSAGDKLDIACSSVAAPASWLMVSRVSGPTLVRNAEWCRRHFARVEGPDQVMQLSQLAGIHAHWTAAMQANEIGDCGPRVSAVAVESHPSNLHLTCEAPLFQMEKAIVPTDALALQYHDPELERATMILPPVTGGPSAQPISKQTSSVRALVGHPGNSMPVQGLRDSPVSITQPGEAPAPASLSGSAIHVMRRSLDTRNNERMAEVTATDVHLGRLDRTALSKTPFANVAFVASMEAGSAATFVAKVADWAPSLDADAAEELLKHPLLLEQFWSLVGSVEKNFFESTAHQIGFGMCEPSGTIALSPDTARAKRAAAVQDLFKHQTKAPRRVQDAGAGDAVSSTPLLDQENAERRKWAARLEQIGKRAGSASRLWEDPQTGDGLSPAESDRLWQLVLTAGAPRTIASYVRIFEKFETWLNKEGIPVFPLTTPKVVKYMLFLDDHECGPTVLPTLRTAIKWVTSRLVIECPDLDEPSLLALQQEVITKRAQTLKEAVPIPLLVVKCLECLVTDDGVPEAARIFVWWWLCLIFASLRFDDGKHVKPQDLCMKDAGLFGLAWQTKVERKRRGTRFAVPNAGFRDPLWLVTGWDLFRRVELDRDFWVPELNSRSEFLKVPPTHSRATQWLKVLAREALDRYGGDRSKTEWASSARQILDLTVHSARVTMLDAAVHAGRSTEEIVVRQLVSLRTVVDAR